jgi:spermidine synthase
VRWTAAETLAGDADVLVRSAPFAVMATALFCSGAAALGAEVVWTRLLTLTFGPTVYAFAMVLAVF